MYFLSSPSNNTISWSHEVLKTFILSLLGLYFPEHSVFKGFLRLGENITVIQMKLFYFSVFDFQDLAEYQAKCQEFHAAEMSLRSQFNLYTEKYDEFQNALIRSNEGFGGFKGEMEKVSLTHHVFF
jgi:hypothetical protein